MTRGLTDNEIKLLGDVFRNTLRYDTIECDTNVMNLGGEHNSFTPAGVVHFSRHVYCEDFTRALPRDRRHFVHEMMHVWQWGHGIYPVHGAIAIFFQTGGNYTTKGYQYDLIPGKSLKSFNIEQQASIVADYWTLRSGLQRQVPLDNNNASPALTDYIPLMEELWKSGPPVRKLAEMQL